MSTHLTTAITFCQTLYLFRAMCRWERYFMFSCLQLDFKSVPKGNFLMKETWIEMTSLFPLSCSGCLVIGDYSMPECLTIHCSVCVRVICCISNQTVDIVFS